MKILYTILLAIIIQSCSSSDSSDPAEKVSNLQVNTYLVDDHKLLRSDEYKFNERGDVSLHLYKISVGNQYKSISQGLNTSQDQKTYYYGSSIGYLKGELANEIRYEMVTNEYSTYKLSYQTINKKSYIKEITELNSNGEELYHLSLDYSKFAENKISIKQTINGTTNEVYDEEEGHNIEVVKKRILVYEADLTIKRLGDNWFPDIQLSEFYPLNLHKELLYSKRLGVFDYFITKIEMKGEENYIQTSTAELCPLGFILKQKIERQVSDPVLSYLNFSHQIEFDYEFDELK